MVEELKYKRLSDESEDDYIWRVCSNKDNSIYNLTWDEVGEILNDELDEDYSSSKWRKNYQVMKKGYDRAIAKNIDAEKALKEINLAKIELEMAAKKKQTEAIYANKVLREHAREEMLKDRVVEAVQKADKIPLPEFEALQISKIGNSEYLLGISDVHAYKMFTSITNTYSKAILEQRMAELLSNVINLVVNEKLDHITVLNGGDDLEGILRESALSMLELGVIDTIVEYRRFMAKWLSELSKYVKIKYIQLISSNHTETRPLNTRAGQMPKEDFEKDIANYIKDILDSNERIEVIVPENDYYHLEIGGQDILCHHGHGIQNPKTYLDSMSRKLKIWFSGLILGHLHTEEIKTFYEDIEGGDVELVRLPSIVGSCEYSDSINKGSKSAALVLRFTENKGRDREYKIVLN